MKSFQLLSSGLLLALLVLVLPSSNVVVVLAQEEAATIEAVVNADGSAGVPLEAVAGTGSTDCSALCETQGTEAIHKVTQEKEHWEGLFNQVRQENDALRGEKDALQIQLAQSQQSVSDLEAKLLGLEQDLNARIVQLQNQVGEHLALAAHAKDQLASTQQSHEAQLAEAKQALEAQLVAARDKVVELEKQAAESHDQLRQHKESRFHVNFQGLFQDVFGGKKEAK